MLSAVTPDSGGYEGLAGYIAGAGTPTGVPGFDVGKRQPVGQPNGAIPGPTGQIPTSSGRPGKPTNQRIVYSRVMTKFSSPADGGLDPERIGEGDIVFVHRYDGINSGYDVNKPTTMATLSQLNAVLKNFNEPVANSTDRDVLFMQAIDANGNLNDPTGVVDPPPLADSQPQRPRGADAAQAGRSRPGPARRRRRGGARRARAGRLRPVGSVQRRG